MKDLPLKELIPETCGPWFVYILECCDSSLYTGVTTNLLRRVKEHNSRKKGARYTRARQPVSLVYQETAASRSRACIREAEIKKMSAAAKKKLISKS